MSSDIYSEKQIAKELTLAVVAKMQIPANADNKGFDSKKFAEQVSEVFEIIHKAVKRSET